jgi:NAD+ kinase
MAMPKNLFLIRHGESEGNIASEKSKLGDHGAFNEDFKSRHSSLWRLSEKGVEQAIVTGNWIRENIALEFHRFYTSEYIRAMETAGHLGITGADWLTEIYLRERNWGSLDRVSHLEREQKFQDAMQDRKVQSFFWTPPNGESLADLCLRVERVIETLHRECAGKNVVIVCHGEVMWAFRFRLERMSMETFEQLELSTDPADKIHNCQIIQYTRTNPFSYDQSQNDYLGWMRSICPWKNTDPNHIGSWKEIQRKRYSNQDLLERVSKITPIVKP